jgi:hypothetical protein
MEEKEPNPNLAYCTYDLNGKPSSQLVCDGVTYEAFSGNMAAYVNKARYQDVPNNGPLPLGRYYLLDRATGGRLGWFYQSLEKRFSNIDHSEWFSLYRDDDQVDDQTTINNIRRGEFRIHPVGPLRISKGCVTLTSHIAFDELKRYVRNKKGEILPGKGFRYYGVLHVLENQIITTY